MNKLFTLLIINILFATNSILANSSDNNKDEIKKDTIERKWSLKFGGYVEPTVFYDTRQVVSARENSLLLYPERIVKDSLGQDINGNPAFNQLAIGTRVNVLANCPDILKAKTSVFVEADFVGTTDATINTLRLRHSYIKMEWKSNELLIGQYWNPMMATEVFPAVNNTNGGAPFHVFARNPQIRYTQKMDDFKLIATLLSQRDFASSGPEGQSPRYAINAAIPMGDLQFQYAHGKFITGIGSQFKTLKPRLRNAKGYKADETVSSLSAMIFGGYKTEKVDIKLQGLWGQNLSDQLSLGGYVEYLADTLTGAYNYANTSAASAWLDINVKCNKWVQVGIFGGYIKNLGYEKEITHKVAFYGRGENIDNIIRISPRVKLCYQKLALCWEMDYSSAAYGKVDAKGKISDLTPAGNLRNTISAYYYF